jgi:hypothetical protein
MRGLALAVLSTFFLLSGQAYSDELFHPLEGAKFKGGISTWLSKGRTQADFFNASNTRISNLEWENVESNIVQLDGEIEFPNLFFVKGVYGYGVIDDGDFTDKDFLADGTEFSKTNHNVTDDKLWYINIDVGRQLFKSQDGKFKLRGFLGYQHLEEKFVSKGLNEQILFGVDITSLSTLGANANAITWETRWDSLRVGLEGDYKFTEKCGVNIKTAWIPHSDFENEDDHHRRTDLAENPSFRDDGIGDGVDFEMNINYDIMERVNFKVGYHHWYFREDGDSSAYGSTGTTTFIPDGQEYETQRYGATFALTYSF